MKERLIAIVGWLLCCIESTLNEIPFYEDTKDTAGIMLCFGVGSLFIVLVIGLSSFFGIELPQLTGLSKLVAMIILGLPIVLGGTWILSLESIEKSYQIAKDAGVGERFKWVGLLYLLIVIFGPIVIAYFIVSHLK
ncbi:MAG: hypothetical protein MK130_04980 [Puniceicoccaceae bacterium]|nr:hypothetical protein [Puniceicoccaceae bacterium]NRA28564.1 hypothetical protein [Opitutales bacterium]